MTQITIWSDRNRHDEQFVFYDLCQHMNSSKDICQKRQALLGPLFKGPVPILVWMLVRQDLGLYCDIATFVS